jgi:hypothetical protein
MGVIVENSCDGVMNFRELAYHLEERIGYHQVPINPAATCPQDLFECCPLHHELMTDLMRAIYRTNRCRKLTDPVGRTETFKAVEPIRLRLLRSANTDVDEFQLMESFCSAVECAFADGDLQQFEEGRRRCNEEPHKAEVIVLDRFRYRRFRDLA